MRILFCNKYNFRFSGTEAYLFDLIDLLRSAGQEVALFSMDCGGCVDREYPQYLLPRIDFKKPGQPASTRIRQAAHIIYSRSVRHRLREAIQDFRPDLVHIRNIYHHLSPSVLWEVRSHRLPLLYQVNDFKMICPSFTLVSRGKPCERCRGGAFWHVWSEGCYPGTREASLLLMAEAYVQKWLKTYASCVTQIVAPTQFVRQKLVENGWDAGTIDVLYHFQRASAEPPKPAPQDAPILYFGRLSAEKGIIDLLRAVQRNRQIPLLLAGDGPQRREIESLARELQLSNVRLLGMLDREQVDRVVAAARFTVFPSHAGEVLGKTILESYAQARAVIATDLGSRRELVTEGKTGLLYSNGDYEQLAAHILFLYQHPQLADEMGRAGHQLLLQRHSPEDHLARMMTIYERMLHKPVKTQVSGTDAGRRAVRVAFIGGRGVVSKYSGIEEYYEEAGKRLAGMGHQVTIYCRTYFTPEAEQHSGMRLIRLPTLRTKHLETVVHTLLSTLDAVFRDYDIVHYHALGPALFSWIPRLFGKKTVVTVQGRDWQRRKWGRVAAAVLRLGESAALTCPNTTIVVSRTLQDYYRAQYQKQTVFVPNGTSVRHKCSTGYLKCCRVEPDNYLLFLGRFSPEKNCDLLIRAYERLDTDVNLVLAGGSSYTDAYANEIRSHASDKIKMLNWVSGKELEELLTNAMLFVLPSDLEGLSLALLDAMGAGLCVLVSDIPENRELVEGAGFSFKAGDETALAEMLRLLIEKPELRRQAGRAAQERIRQHYLWPNIAGEIESVYLKVLGWPTEVHRSATSASATGDPSKAA